MPAHHRVEQGPLHASYSPGAVGPLLSCGEAEDLRPDNHQPFTEIPQVIRAGRCRDLHYPFQVGHNERPCSVSTDALQVVVDKGGCRGEAQRVGTLRPAGAQLRVVVVDAVREVCRARLLHHQHGDRRQRAGHAGILLQDPPRGELHAEDAGRDRLSSYRNPARVAPFGVEGGAQAEGVLYCSNCYRPCQRVSKIPLKHDQGQAFDSTIWKVPVEKNAVYRLQVVKLPTQLQLHTGERVIEGSEVAGTNPLGQFQLGNARVGLAGADPLIVPVLEGSRVLHPYR